MEKEKELNGGQMIKTCANPNCNKMFVTERTKVMYCSKTCSNKDRLRAKMTTNREYQIMSCGGGIQSSGMIACIVSGKLPKPDRIVISPGPCTPLEAGISNEILRRFGGKLPILGVCLGHQCIGHVFGGEVVRAPRLMHGKTSMIHHDGKTIFAGLPNPFEATRYHSLIIKRETLPDCLEITAETDQQEIMGVRHKRHQIEGVQFHPESILTGSGKQLLRNFVES
jgi:anthranilate synthase/aminodeoxychorismate synthase-like glutamine amidotransferase